MEWISKNQFQVKPELPKRTLRGITKKEKLVVINLIRAHISERRRTIQEEATEQISDLEEEAKTQFITEEQYKTRKEQIERTTGASVRLLTRFLNMPNLSERNVVTVLTLLPMEQSYRFHFEYIKIFIPDFDYDNEFMEMTEGETNHLLEIVNQLSNASHREAENLAFLPDSSEQNTKPGTAGNVGNSGSIPKEIVTNE